MPVAIAPATAWPLLAPVVCRDQPARWSIQLIQRMDAPPETSRCATSRPPASAGARSPGPSHRAEVVSERSSSQPSVAATGETDQRRPRQRSRLPGGDRLADDLADLPHGVLVAGVVVRARLDPDERLGIEGDGAVHVLQPCLPGPPEVVGEGEPGDHGGGCPWMTRGPRGTDVLDLGRENDAQGHEAEEEAGERGVHGGAVDVHVAAVRDHLGGPGESPCEGPEGDLPHAGGRGLGCAGFHGHPDAGGEEQHPAEAGGTEDASH